MTAIESYLAGSVDVANTILKETFRRGVQPTIAELFAQIVAVEREHEKLTGRTVTNDDYRDAGDGFGLTTSHLRWKFAHAFRPHDRVREFIPLAGGGWYSIKSAKLRAIIRRVIA